MKILCYSNKLNKGGAERVMSVVANGLYNRGHDVILVNDYKTDNEYKLLPGIRHVYIDGEYGTNKNAIKRNINRICFLRKICRDTKRDVILSFISDANFRAEAGVIGIRTKSVISVRIDPAHAYKSKFYEMIAKSFYKHADGCIFQTKYAANFYPDKVIKHSMVIPNPISDDFFEIQGSPMSEKRIVSVGRLSEQKRFDILISAFKYVNQKFPDFTLDIYGSGEEKEKLEMQISKLQLTHAVTLKGQTKNICDEIKNAYMFVLSSDYEGMPNAMIEAMALGLTVVATGYNGIEETIKNQKTGIVVPCGDIKALSHAICDMIEDKETAHKIADNAREYAKNYRKDSIIDLWESYLCDVTGEKSAK